MKYLVWEGGQEGTARVIEGKSPWAAVRQWVEKRGLQPGMKELRVRVRAANGGPIAEFVLT